MALNPAYQWSGGNLLDADGRLVVVFEATVAPKSAMSGGEISDVDGRTVVVVEAAGS